jgi:hypothetical protein
MFREDERLDTRDRMFWERSDRNGKDGCRKGRIRGCMELLVRSCRYG